MKTQKISAVFSSMSRIVNPVIGFGFVFIALLILPLTGAAQELSKPTQKILQDLKLDASILSGLDEELDVPPNWIAEATKEGKVAIRGVPASSQMVRSFLAPFKDRYPFIDVEYFGAGRQERLLKTLVALKGGRYLGDVVTGLGSFLPEFEANGGVEDLRDLPAIKYVPDELKGVNWTATGTNYWCMVYNTKLVKKKDLPERWEDLLGNPMWRNGNLALGNRPNQVAAHLWVAKGEKWTESFLTRLFTELKPQRRKEAVNAMGELAAAGEFYAAVPAFPAGVDQLVKNGAPVSFHCPEPFPAYVGNGAIILKGSPNVYAARVFLNWFLSKEGQIAFYAATSRTPVHKELQRKELLPFSEAIVGKEQVLINPEIERKFMPSLEGFWKKVWLKREN